MITNLLAPVLITLVTNQVASTTTGDERFETYIVNERHVTCYTNNAKVFTRTNDYQVSIERRKFIAERTVRWKEVPMPASPPVAPPMPGSGTNNFGSVNQ